MLFYYWYTKGHLQARICTLFNISKTSDAIPHDTTYQWLHDTAVKLLPDTLMPTTSNDPVLQFHRTFLHVAYLEKRYQVGEWSGNNHTLEAVVATLHCYWMQKLLHWKCTPSYENLCWPSKTPFIHSGPQSYREFGGQTRSRETHWSDDGALHSVCVCTCKFYCQQFYVIIVTGYWNKLCVQVEETWLTHTLKSSPCVHCSWCQLPRK